MGGREARERGKDGTDRWVLIIKILSFSLSPGKLAAENRLRRDVSITNGRYCRTAEESPLSSLLFSLCRIADVAHLSGLFFSVVGNRFFAIEEPGRLTLRRPLYLPPSFLLISSPPRDA